jgi:hypothetical protein
MTAVADVRTSEFRHSGRKQKFEEGLAIELTNYGDYSPGDGLFERE